MLDSVRVIGNKLVLIILKNQVPTGKVKAWRVVCQLRESVV